MFELGTRPTTRRHTDFVEHGHPGLVSPCTPTTHAQLCTRRRTPSPPQRGTPTTPPSTGEIPTTRESKAAFPVSRGHRSVNVSIARFPSVTYPVWEHGVLCDATCHVTCGVELVGGEQKDGDRDNVESTPPTAPTRRIPGVRTDDAGGPHTCAAPCRSHTRPTTRHQQPTNQSRSRCGHNPKAIRLQDFAVIVIDKLSTVNDRGVRS